MTVNEALLKTVSDLERIKVPVTELQSIGVPIMTAVANIKSCVDAMAKAEQEAKEKAPDEEGGESE